MDKRVILILVLVIVIVAGIGAALLLLTKQSAPAPTPTPIATPVATPVTVSPTQPALTAVASTSLASGQPGTIDIYLDTKNTAVTGFQFIASLTGSSLPTVVDADPATDGVQIAPATITALTTSTNSVTSQDSAFVIRFAMVAADGSTGFTTSGPTKVASISVNLGSGGNVILAFNQQNSRFRPSTGGDDQLMNTTDGTFSVQASAPSSASGSATLTTGTSTTTSPIAQTTTGSAFCLASCFTDSDCAAGFVCETDRCVNPACPTSQTCGCGVTQTGTQTTSTPLPLATTMPVATVKPTTTPKATLIPAAPTAPVATSSGSLPSTGSLEYTLLTLGAGLLLIGGGVFLTAKQEV